jgi:N-acetyl-anhydromuramyl-L-alanine amidase AmpD
MTRILTLSWSARIKALDTHERAKSYPNRYPVNSDSVGIELVGKHIDDKAYEAVTSQQNSSLGW